MQTTAISMAVLLALSGAASLTADDEGLYTNEDWFQERVGDHWDPELRGTLHTGSGEQEITLAEASALFAERSEGIDLHTMSGNPLGVNVTAGEEIVIIEEALGTDLTVGCSNHGDGNGGHSTVSIDNPAPQPGTPLIKNPYYGVATSDISTEGIGFVINLMTGDEWIYSGEVHYAGNSDFWCLEIVFDGLLYVINFPFLDGAFLGPV